MGRAMLISRRTYEHTAKHINKLALSFPPSTFLESRSDTIPLEIIVVEQNLSPTTYPGSSEHTPQQAELIALALEAEEDMVRELVDQRVTGEMISLVHGDVVPVSDSRD